MYFRLIEDSRNQAYVIHPLVDVLKLVMIAILCGMDELDKIIEYGENKKEFLEKEFEIKLIPSKPTLTRIIATINPKWLSLSVVCILNTLIKNKPNQGNFYKDVYAMFDDEYMDNADKDCEYETYSTTEKSHGRIEKRTCYVLNEVEFFTDYIAEWKGLKKIFAVKREVERDGNKTTEISCYLSSKNTTAENLLAYTRNHWQIESMHHILDVTYDEDLLKILQFFEVNLI